MRITAASHERTTHPFYKPDTFTGYMYKRWVTGALLATIAIGA
jgi:hypothetical protein